MGLKMVHVSNLIIRGQKLGIEIKGERFFVTLDGQRNIEEKMGHAVELSV